LKALKAVAGAEVSVNTVQFIEALWKMKATQGGLKRKNLGIFHHCYR